MKFALIFIVLLAAPAAAETGQASIDYGRATPFDGAQYGGRVATGERFDPTIYAVAHRTLPLHSLVMVVYRRQWSVAVINDRGPCLSDFCQRTAPKRVRERILDLTPALAEKLRFPGLGRVTVVSLAEARPAP